MTDGRVLRLVPVERAAERSRDCADLAARGDREDAGAQRVEDSVGRPRRLRTAVAGRIDGLESKRSGVGGVDWELLVDFIGGYLRYRKSWHGLWSRVRG